MRRRQLLVLAGSQAGVVHRRQLYELGVTRSEVRAQLQAGRWTSLGPQTLQLTGADQAASEAWRAVLEVGPAAVLGGVSALHAAGLRGVTSDVIHIAAPKSSRPRRARGVLVHETRRMWPECLTYDGLPRMHPAPAAVFAALWARSDRQGALYIVAAVQQQLTSGDQLREAVDHIRRHPRRRLLQALVVDVTDGAHSLGELDFARLCRRRGLPEPTRQQVVRLPSGRVYLDVCWDEYRLVVEIDGIQHREAAALIPDALRQNAVTLGGRRVLRIPVIALRTDPDTFIDQVEDALRAAGWPTRTPLRPTNRAQ